jgi:DNA-binding LacI/PurR family transcriptional regulator
VSARDVADLAGVSRAAVSRSFTPGASVSPKTRAKVMAAADALGYQVNRLARGLIRAETGLVALIVAEINTPHRSDLLAALTERLQHAGKVALVINTDRSDGDVERALEQAVAYRTDAAVVLSGMPARSLTDTCLRYGMRLVLINRDEERPGSLLIRLDDASAGRRAFAALHAAGCRRIPVVGRRRPARWDLLHHRPSRLRCDRRGSPPVRHRGARGALGDRLRRYPAGPVGRLRAHHLPPAGRGHGRTRRGLAARSRIG